MEIGRSNIAQRVSYASLTVFRTRLKAVKPGIPW
jgi:hypothetical protein